MSLRDCRERVDMSITHVANELGVDRRTYYLWESCNRDIPSSMLIKLAKLFKCSLNDLLDYYPDSSDSLYVYVKREYIDQFIELAKKFKNRI